MLDEIIGGELFAGFWLMVEALPLFAVLPFRCRRIHRKDEILPGFVSGMLDGFQNVLNRIFIGVKIGCKAPLVAHRRRLTFLFEEGLERVEHLC